MKVLAFLLAEEIESRDGRDTLRNLSDGLACPSFPVVSNLWVYANLQLARDDEGRVVELGLDLLDPVGKSSRVFAASATGPSRTHPDMPSVWGVTFHVSVPIPRPGIYGVRLVVGGEALSERPLLVSEEAPGIGT